MATTGCFRVGDWWYAGTIQDLVFGVGKMEARAQFAVTAGATTIGDGGANTFFWNPTSTATANGTTVLATVPNATGRFHSMSSGLTLHHPTHEFGGNDVVNGNLLSFTQAAVNFTPTTTGSVATSTSMLSATTKGIDNALGALNAALAGKASTTHAPTHVYVGTTLGSDPVDGDNVAIDFVPTNYTRATVPGVTSVLASVTGNFAGIDTRFGALASAIASGYTVHAPTHLQGQIDAINGDGLEFSQAGVNYSANATTVSGVPSATPGNTLTIAAAIRGLDVAVGNKAPITHATTHYLGAADGLNASMCSVSGATNDNYTPHTTGTYDSTNHLGARINGIDDALGDRVLKAGDTMDGNAVLAFAGTASITNLRSAGFNNGATLTKLAGTTTMGYTADGVGTSVPGAATAGTMAQNVVLVNSTGTLTEGTWQEFQVPYTVHGINYSTGYWHLEVKCFSYPGTWIAGPSSVQEGDRVGVAYRRYFWNPQRTEGPVINWNEMDDTRDFGASDATPGYGIADYEKNGVILSFVPPNVTGPNGTVNGSAWRAFVRANSGAGSTSVKYGIIVRIIDGIF